MTTASRRSPDADGARWTRGIRARWIRARTGEGRERAKARGVDGETVREIARRYNVSHSTISRLRG